MANAIEVKVPDIGDFKNIPVIEILVKPGDTVRAEDPLVTLESDKATMEVPSPAAGTVKEIRIKVGDKVSEGALVLMLEAGTEAPAATAKAAPAPAAPAAPAPVQGLPWMRRGSARLMQARQCAVSRVNWVSICPA